MPSQTKPETCPSCGSKRVVPIAYGFPSAEMFERAERGEIALGGCVLHLGTSPLWMCLDCRERGGVLGS